MTPDEIRGALKQVEVHCDLLMDNYEMVSLRGALYTLGFTEAEADDVIAACVAGGFDYCVDHRVRNRVSGEFPSADVCHYGPDQLKSRVQCVRIP